MEISPTFLLTLGIALLSGVAWLIRLESKTSTNTRDLDTLSKDVYEHSSNGNVHHSADDLDRRFNELKDDISEIKDNIREGLKEIGHRIDRLFTK